jgi:hypothetical protein
MLKKDSSVLKKHVKVLMSKDVSYVKNYVILIASTNQNLLMSPS